MPSSLEMHIPANSATSLQGKEKDYNFQFSNILSSLKVEVLFHNLISILLFESTLIINQGIKIKFKV